MRTLPALLVLLFAAATASANVDLAVSFSPAPRALVAPGQTFDIAATPFNLGTDAAKHATVTFIVPPEFIIDSASGDGWSTAISGNTIIATWTPPERPLHITLTAPAPAHGGRYQLTAGGDVRDASLTLDVFRTFTVTTDAGSLRAAIAEANAQCDGSIACRIVFAQPMAIHPATPLPAITGCDLLVDGGPAAAIDDPRAVEISGERTASGNGLEIRSACGVTLRGLAIDGFPANGVVLASPPASIPQPLQIISCSIGTDSAAETVRPNGLRGISLESPYTIAVVSNSVISGNTRSGIAAFVPGTLRVDHSYIGIGKERRPLPNGASGIFIAGGNVSVADSIVASNHEFGIALGGNGVALVTDSAVTENVGPDIDYGLDGPTPLVDRLTVPPTPQLIRAEYDAAANVTHVVVDEPATGISDHAYDVEIHSLVPDANGRTKLAVRRAPATSDVFTIDVPGDHRGETIRALAQFYWLDTSYYGTSEFSAPLSIPNAP